MKGSTVAIIAAVVLTGAAAFFYFRSGKGQRFPGSGAPYPPQVPVSPLPQGGTAQSWVSTVAQNSQGLVNLASGAVSVWDQIRSSPAGEGPSADAVSQGTADAP